MKHLLALVLLVCLGTFASAQIPSYVPTNGLVGWWPFNGNANDESGNGNHGTVNGATLAADRFGNPGKAYSFDGVNDWITSNPSNLPINNQSRSISSWFNTSSGIISTSQYPNIQTIIAWGTSAGGYVIFNQHVISPSGKGYFESGSGTNPLFTDSIVNNGQWHNFITTYEQDGRVRIYIDGRYVDSSSNVILTTQNSIIGIGNSPWANIPFRGLIDDIAIYNRALTAAEVQQLYLVNCRPTFTSQPQNTSVGQGQTTTFAVQVDTTSTFQWQMNLGLGAGWVNIPQSSLFSGDTTATLSVQGRNPLDGAQFRCIATACQSDTSNAATLTVTSNSSTLGSVAGVPGKINYQGAAVDSLGKPMKNQTIALKLSVLDSSSSGAAAYVETHSTPTNGSGLFSLQIGGGTAVSGSFDSIPWANGRNKYLKTEVQQNGTWVNLGTSQLVSVPYALHSGSAENANFANQAATLRDSLGNAYQIKTVNGQPTLVSAPGNISTPGTFACGQAVTYAGESYPTVQIGTQCWFQKNVNVGSMVLGANDQTNNGILEKYCYNNDPANCGIFGGLFQWAEAVQYQNGTSNSTSPNPAFAGNIQGICPTGWHVPSDGEWCTLTTFLDATVNCGTIGWIGTDVGGKMKSTSGIWTAPNIGATNSSGFSALPSGFRDLDGTYGGLGRFSLFWLSTESSNITGYRRDLNDNNILIHRTIYEKKHGYNIRCLKD